ncbi:MAG: sulfatase/phosphatase domain-containing protein [Kiritimatiellia bacterium]
MLDYKTMLLGAAFEIAGPDCPDAHYEGIGFDIRGAAGRLLLAKELPAELPAILDGRRELRQPFYLQIAISETHVDRLDEGLGHVMNILDQRAMTDNTVLVFTTDRGMPSAEAEPTLYDRDIGVALIMRYPGCFAPAQRFPDLVSHIDVLPTLLEAAGRIPPKTMNSPGLFALLSGQSATARECIFAEMNFNRDYIPKRCVRTDRYKYIFSFAGTGNHFDELYDLESDPQESHNLSRSFSDLYDALGQPFGTRNLTGYPGDISDACLYGGAAEPAMEELRHKLAADLAQWMTDTDDPVLEGPVASPRFYDKIAWLKEQKG